jgi:hypothetical protein
MLYEAGKPAEKRRDAQANDDRDLCPHVRVEIRVGWSRSHIGVPPDLRFPKSLNGVGQKLRSAFERNIGKILAVTLRCVQGIESVVLRSVRRVARVRLGIET